MLLYSQSTILLLLISIALALGELAVDFLKQFVDLRVQLWIVPFEMDLGL